MAQSTSDYPPDSNSHARTGKVYLSIPPDTDRQIGLRIERFNSGLGGFDHFHGVGLFRRQFVSAGDGDFSRGSFVFSQTNGWESRFGFCRGHQILTGLGCIFICSTTTYDRGAEPLHLCSDATPETNPVATRENICRRRRRAAPSNAPRRGRDTRNLLDF